MKISIKTRLIVGLLVTTSLILIAIFFVVAMNFSNQAITSSTSAAQSDLSQINNSISIFLDESKKSVNLLANYPLSKSLDEVKTTFVNSKQDQLSTIADDDGVGKKLVELFLAMQNSHPAFVDVYSASPNGGFILANQTTILPAGYDPRQRPWYKDALMYPDQTTIGEAYLSATGEAVTTISRSVLRNSTPVGVVAVDISLKKLTDLTGSIKLGQNGYVVLVQSDGIILADPHNEKNNFKNIKEIKSQALKDLFQMDSGSLEFEDETGAQWVGVVSTSEQTQWKIFGFISKSEIMAPVYKTLMNLVYIAIVSLVLIGVLIWLIASKAIIKPLSSVNIFLGRIREGDYAYREPHSRTDEIGAIIDSLNTMAEVLEGNITEIGHKTREAEHKALVAEEASQEAHEARCHAESAKNDGMMHAASTLEGIVGIVNSTSQELSAQIEDASQGALNQAELVSETATAMDEMTTTVLEVARNAAQASETAESAKTKAQEGANKVGEVLIGIEDVTKQSSLLKNDMGQLGDQAKDISRILTVISDIADQTNLLALNAAIEAARAGEAGRGFAVVADEVRKLAEKTMVATKEVGDAILAIQQSAKTNIDNVDRSVILISNTAELASHSGTALNEIMELVDMVSDQVRVIATASEEQSSSSESINRSIAEVNEISSRVSHAMGDASQAVLEMTDQASQLQNLIGNLRDEAGQVSGVCEGKSVLSPTKQLPGTKRRMELPAGK